MSPFLEHLEEKRAEPYKKRGLEKLTPARDPLLIMGLVLIGAGVAMLNIPVSLMFAGGCLVAYAWLLSKIST